MPWFGELPDPWFFLFFFFSLSLSRQRPGCYFCLGRREERASNLLALDQSSTKASPKVERAYVCVCLFEKHQQSQYSLLFFSLSFLSPTLRLCVRAHGVGTGYTHLCLPSLFSLHNHVIIKPENHQKKDHFVAAEQTAKREKEGRRERGAGEPQAINQSNHLIVSHYV